MLRGGRGRFPRDLRRGARARIPSVEAVIEDLGALEDVLLVAKKKKVRFRLELA
jgi:hypothetical protein